MDAGWEIPPMGEKRNSYTARKGNMQYSEEMLYYSQQRDKIIGSYQLQIANQKDWAGK